MNGITTTMEINAPPRVYGRCWWILKRIVLAMAATEFPDALSARVQT